MILLNVVIQVQKTFCNISEVFKEHTYRGPTLAKCKKKNLCYDNVGMTINEGYIAPTLSFNFSPTKCVYLV